MSECTVPSVKHTTRTMRECEMKCRPARSRCVGRSLREPAKPRIRHGTIRPQRARRPGRDRARLSSGKCVGCHLYRLGHDGGVGGHDSPAPRRRARSRQIGALQHIGGSTLAGISWRHPCFPAGGVACLGTWKANRPRRDDRRKPDSRPNELDAHLATRIETKKGMQVHREVYYFPPHSRMRFEHKPDQKFVLLKIDMATERIGYQVRPIGRL